MSDLSFDDDFDFHRVIFSSSLVVGVVAVHYDTNHSLLECLCVIFI